MPQISRFYGIVIEMYHSDHAPPHFHALYGEYEVTVEIRSGMVQGKMPKRALRMVLDWLDLHEIELMDNWERARARDILRKIDPLV